jgi:hypothetical protein
MQAVRTFSRVRIAAPINRAAYICQRGERHLLGCRWRAYGAGEKPGDLPVVQSTSAE